MSIPTTGQPVTIDWGSWLWCSAYSYIVIAIFIITTIAVFAYHLWQNHRTPLESRDIKEASNRRKATMLVANDDGNVDVKIAWTTNSGEGYSESQPKRSGKAKWKWLGIYPQQGLVPTEVDVDEGKDLTKTRNYASMLAELNTKKLHLRGARIPIWVGVQSQAILMSLHALAGLEGLELYEAWFKSQYPNNIFPVDVHAVKRMVFGSNYSESQIQSIQSDSEFIGEERAKKGEGLNKMVLLAGIAFGVIGMVALGIAAFIA